MFKIISKKRIIKVKEYREGARVYLCPCGHTVTAPKFRQGVKCVYCGRVREDN